MFWINYTFTIMLVVQKMDSYGTSSEGYYYNFSFVKLRRRACSKCRRHSRICEITTPIFFHPQQKSYNDNCNFKEVFLENYFNAYSSAKWTRNGKEMFIALSQKGRPLRGKKTRREHVASHFIPMKCREERRVD